MPIANGKPDTPRGVCPVWEGLCANLPPKGDKAAPCYLTKPTSSRAVAPSKNYGILQTNSMGIIDNSYCGENDQWNFPAYTTHATTIHKNDRICQFRIQKKQPKISFEKVGHLKEESRGDFGSTGISTYDEEWETFGNEYEAAENIFLGSPHYIMRYSGQILASLILVIFMIGQKDEGVT